MHTQVSEITKRIAKRSHEQRSAYLKSIEHMRSRSPAIKRGGCANLAHVSAALTPSTKKTFFAGKTPHLGIVTAYNDMLSAHQPYAHYPSIMLDEATRHGATLQVAGGVPAMCDGITQGTPSMELSLFSRDVIAQATAIALSHDVFDAALLLGICDKIVPGLLIGALHFGHLPCLFVPAGPMVSGLSNTEKAKTREGYAAGRLSREHLQAAENAAYHTSGTCTFYGTANSNQLLLEAMGLHVPNAAFINPHDSKREHLTREAVRYALSLSSSTPLIGIGDMVDEHCIVNAMVVLLATGGSTNHLIHWIAVARAAGIAITWDDFSALSAVVPLITRIYPNGEADINQFHQAGGVALVLRELLDAGLLHESAKTVHPKGLRAATVVAPAHSLDDTIIRSAKQPFTKTGGITILSGNLGRAVIKTSAVPSDYHIIEAPARVFDSQQAFQEAFKQGALELDFIAVVRFQGPRANGMPELHKLMPPLAVLLGRGYRVALVTDGRLSGASGKAPSAIHLYPEAIEGGMIARLQDGDLLRLDAVNGTLNVLHPDPPLMSRPLAQRNNTEDSYNYGRELFATMRHQVTHAEQGACIW